MGAGRIKSAQPRHLAAARALSIAFWCSLTLAAWAQSIKIPDFRQPPPPITGTRPNEPCNDCGRILSIREIRLDRRPEVPSALQGDGPGSAAGPVGPNLVGAVIYLPLGGDSPQRPFVGGVGTPEMKERFRESIYEIAVRFDDGSLRFLQRPDGARYQVGDRVKATGAGQLELIAN